MTSQKKPLRITVISEVFSGNGASNAAHRLANALGQRGHLITYLWSFRTKSIDENFSFFDRKILLGPERYLLYQNYEKKNWFYKKVYRLVERIFVIFEKWEFKKVIRQENPDVINLHNVAALLNHDDIVKLSQKAPIIWTLHDQYAYRLYHNRFTNRRGQEITTWETDFPGQLQDKIKHFEKFKKSNARVSFVCPSNWLAAGLKESLGDQFPVYVLPNIFPENDFHIRDRAQARAALKLPGNKKIEQNFKVILFVSDRIQNDLKNFNTLVDAVQRLNDPLLKILPIGRMTDKYKAQLPPCVLPPFFANTSEKIAMAYAVCDVVAVCSFVENLPNVVIEGMLCGRPIAAGRVGGIPEMFNEPDHGIFFDPMDPRDMAIKLHKIIRTKFDPQTLRGFALSKTSNQVIVEEFEKLAVKVYESQKT